jgi:CubicO group peptidase (beta-lactamase class C family)
LLRNVAVAFSLTCCISAGKFIVSVMKKLYFLIFWSFIGISVSAQRINRDKFLRDSLDSYVNRALTNWRIPGAAVGIVKDNKIVLIRGYGIKELGLNAKVDNNTLFMIGSNTKAFTATALATLQAENKINLNDRVSKYLPDFKLYDPLANSGATLRDLLCHRLGFETFQGDFAFYNSNLTRQQVISTLGKIKPVYPFRSKWGYTNAAFLTAGEALAKVTGQPWEAYIKERFFAPLGMTNTLALSSDFNKALNRSAAHTIVDNRLTAIPYVQGDNLAPAGGIGSSAADMSKWMLALLNDGKVGNKQVIPAAAIEATRQPQAIVGQAETGEFELYGLGWFLEQYHDRRLVLHTGGVNGFVSSVTLVPSLKLGIVILTNSDQNDLISSLNREIIDAYLKLPYHAYADRSASQTRAYNLAEQQRDRKLRDSVALNLRTEKGLNDYTGTYYNEVYGNVTVARGETNDLIMRFEHHPKMSARMQALGGNRFYTVFSDPAFGKAVLPFYVQNNTVTGLRVKVADFVDMMPYDFRKVGK